eukprot:13134526-Ditylum_brightwellii.AAC.1
MDKLIQGMKFNLISPTSACSTTNGNDIVEEDFIVFWNNVRGEFIHDKHFKHEVETVHYKNTCLGSISGDAHKNFLYKSSNETTTAAEQAYTQLPFDLQSTQPPFEYFAGDVKLKMKPRIAA